MLHSFQACSRSCSVPKLNTNKLSQFLDILWKMVRGKVQMKRIEDATSRQVTFSKRRNGIMKKAYELSVLCDAEVAVIIFSQKGRLYEFSSSSMQKAIGRYRENTKEALKNNNSIEVEHHMEHLKEETANIAKKIEILEVSKRKLMGQGIGSCSMNELQEIDNQLERNLKNIRARKTQLFKDEIERLKAKEKQLLEENERLSEECGLRRQPEAPPPPLTRISQQKETASCSHSVQNTEVETDLFIGLPDICWS
ncbi:PREDICTED: MADS-box protein AGL42-like isoform X2 [Nicotiana attenuata]|uniref:MADS-box protein AGL42-like isoform X2 n=1 Tax=Nicotiana attenuata TaxID=49451 RepID=UPI000904FC0D|nr:PREDICTED: MADS-box protein AGL42-like isoform X2 [Nicotiana attenuata]